MVLEGAAPDSAGPGVTIKQRITWIANADFTVRQLWESSENGGKTWAVAFDGKYVRKKRP